ncbi:hypothetical protein EsH8_XI_000014 [Colletotrichum jinshuiense]
MATATIATFHLFPHLPAKLRARIWELTVDPRIVEVRMLYKQPNPTNVKGSEPDVQGVDQTVMWSPIRHPRSPTPAPAQLQTCREARQHLTTCPDSIYRFEKAFSNIATTHDLQQEHYIWFNFNNDMLSIGKTDLHEFLAVAYQIRRLRLQRDLSEEYFSRTESLLLGRRFKNVAEVHLISLWGIRSGYLVTEDIDFPCGPENVYFIDPEEMGGTIMNSVDLDAMVAREYEELYGPAEQG